MDTLTDELQKRHVFYNPNVAELRLTNDKKQDKWHF